METTMSPTYAAEISNSPEESRRLQDSGHSIYTYCLNRHRLNGSKALQTSFPPDSGVVCTTILQCIGRFRLDGSKVTTFWLTKDDWCNLRWIETCCSFRSLPSENSRARQTKIWVFYWSDKIRPRIRKPSSPSSLLNPEAVDYPMWFIRLYKTCFLTWRQKVALLYAAHLSRKQFVL